MSEQNQGVFSVSSSIVIDAPPSVVWKVILDFPAYKEWNSFVRVQTKLDKSKKPFADQTTPIELGTFLRLGSHIPPTMDESISLTRSDEVITELDPTNFRVAWKFLPPVPGILNAERWQQLEETEDGKTKFETKETFYGPVAYVVRWMLRDKLQNAFEVYADDLKKRSESLA
ncbi:hypothetical protein PENSPDRAFT_690226 [Peniophora sp. CONT]|nr:hypothetical protein PENSPDRAFT_690226 [Peniophora sp. CONT]